MRDKRAATRTVVFNVSQNPPCGQLGPWGAKKVAKRQPQREVLTTRLCHQEIDDTGTLVNVKFEPLPSLLELSGFLGVALVACERD